MARRSPLYLMAVFCLSALGMLLSAAPASAHATLESSTPAEGSIVAHAPANVTVTFDEPVGVSPDSLRVFAPDGTQVNSGNATNGARPQEVIVPLRPGLGNGTYTVSWHVISADSHPVQGAFTFSIGAPSNTVVNQASLLEKPNHLVNFAFWLVRWLAFWCFALLSGAISFIIWCWPEGVSRRSVMRLAMGAWGGLAAAVLGAILLQGAYGSGQGMTHVFWPDLMHSTLHSRYGLALGVRLLLVVVALFVFTVTLDGYEGRDRRERVIAGTIWGVVTAGLAVTWSVADHSGTGTQVALAVPADVLHLCAMVTWLGGLVMLVAIVLRPAPPIEAKSARDAAGRRHQVVTVDAARAVMRFSPIALNCVIGLIVSGTYLAWRNVGTVGALFATAYGQLLLAKIGGLSALICLGYLARLRIANGLKGPVAAVRSAEIQALAAVSAPVPAKGTRVKAAAAAKSGGTGKAGTLVKAGTTVKAGTPVRARAGHGGNGNGSGPDHAGPEIVRIGVTLRRLRWSVTIESFIALSVLAIAAVLVNTPTARESYSPPAHASQAFNTGGPGGSGNVSLTVTPDRLGTNQLRITITGANGKPYRPQQLQASLLLPARGLGPLTIRLTPAGPGVYSGGPALISAGGQWQVRLVIRSDAFDETTVALPFSAR